MKASETKLQLLIEGTKQYVIPLFQRVYSWDRKQWEIFWDDLIELYETPVPKDHFMGSIVTMPVQSKPEGVSKFLLIDGQQRLTTFYILLSVLRDISKTSGTLSKQIEDLYMFNKYANGNDYYKILPTQGDREFFFKILKSISFESESQINKAYKYFLKEITKSNANPEKLKNILIANLSIVSITLEKEDNPYLIFEGLNYKGLPLTQGDLIRNYFFMRIHVDKQEEIYLSIWKPIQDALSENLTTYIRHFLIKDSREVKESEIYSSLKVYADKMNDDKLIEYLTEVYKFSKYYTKLLNPELESNENIRIQLKRLNRIDVTTAYPFLLNIYNDYEMGIITSHIFYELLGILENFIMRRFICGVPTNQLNKIFPFLYRSLNSSNLIVSLKENLRVKNYPKNREFREKFSTAKLYGAGDRNEKAKLILETFESNYHHGEQVPFEELTLEHIMPQTLTIYWERYLGEDWRNIHDICLHTIGNLTLVGQDYNSEMSNNLYDMKKEYFINVSHIELNRQYFRNVSNWNEEEILKRASYLTDKAIEIWPSLWGDTEPTEQPRLVITNKVTGTKPTTLLICGQKINVTSWKDVLIKTLEVVYTIDEEKFKLLIDEYPNKINKIMDGMRVPQKLSNGFYAEVNLSAESIKNFCLQIINELELTEEDWKVEIK